MSGRGAAGERREPREPAPGGAGEGVQRAGEDASGRIAVIGLAGRFPGAGSPAELWRIVRDGRDAITRFSVDELVAEGVPAAVARRADYVPARGVVAGVELFDAGFFGLTPREAEIMDPQHRLFLECAWEACEGAGYDPAAYPGRIGIFGGSGFSSYLVSNLLSVPELLDSARLQARLSNDKDFLTTFTSYKLDLRGPSVAVQTACSTALVAVHLACQALLCGECDMALAGGVTLAFPHRTGYLYQEGGIVSPDGRCRAFDARARGTVESNGAGIVLLRPLADALAAGDFIQAVILGSAVNNDGGQKASYTAPSVESQVEAIAEAQAIAGVAPDSIGLLEAHGSGTPLGDPLEVAALTRAFRAGTSRKAFCALGSVKSNIGHADTAAGAASLIKAIFALRHRALPPTLHCEEPNPRLELGESPFFLSDRLRDWPRGETPRRAGVNSLGIGGTNAHLVLEEAPTAPPPAPSRPWQLLLLSARSRAALDAATARLARALAAGLPREPPDAGLEDGQGDRPEDALEHEAPGAFGPAGSLGAESALADIAHTLRVGRRPFRHRRALVCSSRQEAARLLAAGGPQRELSAEAEGVDEIAGVAFLFPGLGEHYAGMAGELYRLEEGFREAIDRCAELLGPRLETDLRELLWPEAGAGGTQGGEAGQGDAAAGAARQAGTEMETVAALATPDLRGLLAAEPEPGPADRRLRRTVLGHPAVFAVEYALAQLWCEWGIEPRAMLGYSLGEYTAACLSGVLSLADALALVATRAALIEQLPGGDMLAVPLPAAELAGGVPLPATPPTAPAIEPATRAPSGPPRSPGASPFAVLGVEGAWLCAANGPALSVVGGTAEAVAEVRRRLAARGVACRQLATAHAFHTPLMEPVAAELTRAAGGVRLSPPRVPFVSNLTGTWITPGEATDPAYWARHLCLPVRFDTALATLLGGGARRLVEVGPGRTLATLCRQHPLRTSGQIAVPSLRDRRERVSDQALLLDSLARLWLAGTAPDWAGFARRERRRRVPLPTYPFERQRFFIARQEASGPATPSSRQIPPDGSNLAQEPNRRLPLVEWFQLPVWEEAPPPPQLRTGEGSRPTTWLVLLPARALGASGEAEASWELGERVACELELRGQRVARALFPAGAASGASSHGASVVAPGRDGFRALFAELARQGELPRGIAYLWALPSSSPREAACEEQEELSFYNLLWLAQALGELPGRQGGGRAPVHLAVVASGLFDVAGGEPVRPESALLLGPCRVLPREMPELSCTVLDVPLQALRAGGDGAGHQARELAAVLVRELLAAAASSAGPPDGVAGVGAPAPEGVAGPAGAARAPGVAGGRDSEIALRGHGLWPRWTRWVRRHRRVLLPEPEQLERPAARVRPDGVYLITGGLEETGLVVAEQLQRLAAAAGLESEAGAAAGQGGPRAALTPALRLALLAPKELPPRSRWEEWLSAHDERDAVCRRLRRAMALETLGCELLVLPVDVTDAGRVAAAVARVRERFGRIDGAVHAAGQSGGGLIQWKTRAAAAAVLAPWVQGTRALAGALRGQELDFFLLFGSSLALTGGFGQVDACAGACFAAAFAEAAPARADGPAAPRPQVIDWGFFRWQPVAVADAALAAQLRLGLETWGITAEECGEVCRRVLANAAPRVLVATRGWSPDLAGSPGRDLAAALGSSGGPGLPAGSPAPSVAGHPRPELPVPYAPPGDETEAAIAGVWEAAFGIDRIGIHDDFFDLAGNSLLAIQIVTRLVPTLGVELPMASLLEAPTVARLAERARELRPAAPAPASALEEGEVEELLREVEDLSLEETSQRLALEEEAERAAREAGARR